MIDHFIRLHNETEQDERYYYSIKTALLKYFLDKGFYFDVRANLDKIFNEFTFNNILSVWSGQDVHIYCEDKICLDQSLTDKILLVLDDEELSFAEEKETVIGEIYRHIYLSEDAAYDLNESMTDLIRKSITAKDKMFDPLCGTGLMVSGFYDAMMNLYFKDAGSDSIRSIHKKILSEHIYGCDPSPISCALTKIILALKDKEFYLCPHIYDCDAFENLPFKLKHLKFDRIAADVVKTAYDNIELYTKFFELTEKMIAPEGQVLFPADEKLESEPSLLPLRKKILSEYSIRTILDFPKQSQSIPRVLVFDLRKKESMDQIVTIRKFSANSSKFYHSSIYHADTISIRQDQLSEIKFVFRDLSLDIAGLVESRCTLHLRDVLHFFQGIITGCDKAFVVDDGSLIYSQCISECGVPWIKGKDITDQINFYGQYLLYTNRKDGIEQYPYSKKRLEMYRSLLEKRRECDKGIREWYELQWGRDRALFLGEKLLFAAKSKKNKFICDKEGYFFSADIYGAVLLPEYSGLIALEKLEILLNSNVYDRYIKTKLDRIGKDRFTYYPNLLKDVMIPPIDVIASFQSEKDIEKYFDAIQHGGSNE